MSDETLLTVGRLADELGVPAARIFELLTAGKLTPDCRSKLGGPRWRVSSLAAVRAILDGKQTSTPAASAVAEPAPVASATPKSNGDGGGWASMSARERAEFGDSKTCYEAYVRALKSGMLLITSERRQQARAEQQQSTSSPAQAKTDATWESMSRSERAQYFGSKEVFEAYRAACARGQVKIKNS